MQTGGVQMIFNKLVIKNFKKYEMLELDLNNDLNILVGDNDAGKSTILEAIALATTGRFGGRHFEDFLSNDIFNYNQREKYLESLSKEPIEPPEILIELYSDAAADSRFKGRNNSLCQDVAGIKYSIVFNKEHSDTYKTLIEKQPIDYVPLDFYRYEWQFFSNAAVSSYINPIVATVIDTAQVNNSIIGSYVGSEINASLSDKEKIELGVAHRDARGRFANDQVLENLNIQIKQKTKFKDKKVAISLMNTTLDGWQKELSLSVDDITFSFSGRGTQSTIKTNLALGRIPDNKSITLLIEEPENNLSHTNMHKLVSDIIKDSTGKQIFIATHSSLIANRLGLDKVIFFTKDKQERLSNLDSETSDYFKKLPGYDTLRFVMASKVILVEGPSDELIVQAAYIKANEKPPIEDGIDIISVLSLAFKRFCDISVLLEKKIAIVTDNDGSIEKKIKNKYNKYNEKIQSGLISIFYEKNEKLHTLEPSFVNANSSKLGKLLTIIGLPPTTTKDDLIANMKNNKTEWALKILQKYKDVEYPTNINECIEHVKK